LNPQGTACDESCPACCWSAQTAQVEITAIELLRELVGHVAAIRTMMGAR